MDVLESHNRETGDIIEEIENRAAAYTTDWRFQPGTPGIGTVLALLYADMMAETVKRFRELPGRYQMEFYNLIGADLLPSVTAKGYTTFSTVNSEVPGARVPAGLKVYADAGDDKVAFETKEEVFVSSARLSNIYYVNGKFDYISSPLTLPIWQQELSSEQFHRFYLAHSTLFSIQTEGEIMIDFHVEEDIHFRELNDILMNRVRWCYYSEDGFVEFSLFRYEGGRVYLHKDKKMPNFAETEICGKKSCWIQMELKRMAPESRIAFPRISLSAEGKYLAPDLIYDGTVELEEDNFFPFGETLYPYAEVYIANDEVFSKKGAWIQMDFSLDFKEYPGELKSVQAPINWRNIMHKSEFEKPEPVDIKIVSVRWEYYNGSGWSQIPGTKSYQEVFQEENGRKQVCFFCPEDIVPYLLAAKERYCIRIRVFKIVNMFAVDGTYIVPRIRKLMMHYQYTSSDVTPDYAFAQNSLDTKACSCSGEVIPFDNPFPQNGMLYLSFTGPLSEEDIRLLFIIEKGGGGDYIPYQYEYYGKDGWALLNIQDETLHLTKTGLLTLCGEHSFVKKDFFGHEGYWIRILQEAETETIILPRIKGIHINSVEIEAQQDTGEKGNLMVGAIDAMDRKIGFINKVTNYDPTAGGCEPEQRDQAVRRNAATLRHLGRAVTARDFEDLVYEEMRSILQVKCFSGRNERGEEAPGHITLVVLADEGRDTGTYFERIREVMYHRLLPHIDEQLYADGRLHIVEPEWISLKTYITVVVKDSAKAYQIREKIDRQIHSFLHPITGNFDGTGWQIGTLPSAMQIQNACNQLEEILYIKQVSVKEEKPPTVYALGKGGHNEIELIME